MNSQKKISLLDSIKKILFLGWIKSNPITILISICLFITILAYGIISKSENNFDSNPNTLITLIVFDFIFILILAVLISKKLFSIWLKRNNKRNGTKLQTQIVLTFSSIVAIPTILVAIFSTLFFNFGIQSWFNSRVSTALNESVEVAEAYFKEHLQLIRNDAYGIAAEISYYNFHFQSNNDVFNSYLSKQAEDRSLVDSIVFSMKPYKIIAKSNYSLITSPDMLQPKAIEEANNDSVVIMNDKDDNKVKALIKINNSNNFLLISRLIDNKVLEHMKNTQGAVSEYNRLKSELSSMQIKFLFVFIFISILLVLTAIWFAISISLKLSRPISTLVNATQRIKEGDFAVHIEEGENNDEISTLAKAFNSMTKQLHKQRKDLIKLNHQIDKRRHFSETIISSVTAGIIATDLNYNITMINPSAISILEIDATKNIESLDSIFPEVIDLLNLLNKLDSKFESKEIRISNKSRNIILLTKVVREIVNKETLGYLITFDDITKLVLAQRSSAWLDVARRIAHEIKNPLTPIKLAADRLYKKFARSSSDHDTFKKYTDTVERYTSSIASMVDEFVNFARMPAPKFEKTIINNILKETLFAREGIHSNIKYSLVSSSDITINCDPSQLSQCFINIIKNSEESILEKKCAKGLITAKLFSNHDQTIIEISDNGTGFPDELFGKLTEAYVTNKPSGTGLGLAIVKKIMDDHNGNIEFLNLPDSGALTRLIFKNL